MKKENNRNKKRYIIGIDEVGRGALAGPITVAAIAATANSKFQIPNSKLKLRDSKKLSLKQREEWFNFIKQQKFHYAIASVSPKIIDKINISQAANLAATKALKRLIINNIYTCRGREKCIQNCKVYLDGGLYINKSATNDRRPTTKNFKIKTIIKGDEKIPAISLASIVAKVKRDRLMKKLHKKYPAYDFIHNVGYGTEKHVKAIKKYGCSSFHRKSFAPCIK